jgi:hypothetical protein
MDFSRIEQLRDELLQNRRLAITAGLTVVAFWIVTLVGGYFLVRHALAPDSASNLHSLNTPTQVGLLLDDSMSELINHIVYFNDVKIESGPSDDVYFATGPKGVRVLVIATGHNAPDASAVDIQGTVRPAPPVTTMTKKWKLTKAEAQKIKEDGIYIEAEDIRADRSVAQQRLAAKK